MSKEKLIIMRGGKKNEAGSIGRGSSYCLLLVIHFCIHVYLHGSGDTFLPIARQTSTLNRV